MKNKNFDEMSERELKIIIEKMKQETRQKYRTKIAEETKKLKLKCKEEIKEKTQELIQIRTIKIRQSRRNINAPHVFKNMARELFGKEYKELTKEEKNKIFTIRQRQRRKAIKEFKANGKNLS